MFYNGIYGNLPPVGVLRERAGAVDNSQNPPYTKQDFLSAFPIFTNKASDDTINEWITMANGVIGYNRYKGYWKFSMGLFVAHNLVLQLKLAGSADDSLKTLLNKTETKGFKQSKSAGSLSVSYDTGSALSDYNGWGTLKDTEYGRQLIDIMKTVGGGGIFYVL